MANYQFADAATRESEAALEATVMQLDQALELAEQAGQPDLVPALLLALAINKNSLHVAVATAKAKK